MSKNKNEFDGVVYAPWSEEQVKSLNGFQQDPHHHPFTGSTGKMVLIATSVGWVEHEGGPVVDNWAHDYMTDGSWRDGITAWFNTLEEEEARVDE